MDLYVSKGTSKMCLCYEGVASILKTYIDANIDADLDSRKFTLRFIILL